MPHKIRYIGLFSLAYLLGACGGDDSTTEQSAGVAGSPSAGVTVPPSAGQISAEGGQTAPAMAGQSMGGSAMVAGQIGAGGEAGGTPVIGDDPMAGGSEPMGGTPSMAGSMSSPAGPPSMEMGDPVPAQSEQLSAVGFIRFAHLPDGRILGQTVDGIALLSDGTRTNLGHGFGEFLDAAQVSNTVMVLSSMGLYVLTEDGLESSPLTDAVPRVTAIAANPRDALWLATDGGLYRWAEGSVRRLMTDGAQFDWSNIQLSPGQLYGTAVIWAVEGLTVVAVGVSDMGPQAWSFELTEAADGITTTSDGLWVAGATTLSLLSNSGEWTVWRKPTDAVVLGGHIAAKDLWLSNGRNLWQWRNEQLRSRTNAPVHTSLRVTDEGAALVSNLTGIYGVISGRFVTVDGLGERLTGDVAISVSPSEADLVESVSAVIDGGDTMQIEGPPWSLDLTLAMIGPGNHTLSIEVRYTDDQQASTTIEFLGPPSWNQDIDPLQQTHCVRCHGQGGSAHLMMDAATWKLEIVEIIDDVETSRMPLNGSTLSQDEIELIRGWRDAGFLE